MRFLVLIALVLLSLMAFPAAYPVRTHSPPLSTGSPQGPQPACSSPSGRRESFGASCGRSWIYPYQSEPMRVSAPTPVRLVQYTNHPADDRGLAWGRNDVLFSSNRSGSWDLWSMTYNKMELQKYSSSPGQRQQPAFFLGQYGSHLAYASNQAGTWDIWADDNFGEDQPLTGAEGDELWPSWSPDGNWIFFASDRTGNWDLWMIHRDGSSLTQLTSTPYNERYPQISPDGHWIAYSSDQSGDEDLWRMRADGSIIQQLTKGPSNDVEPSWSPDGSRIAFASDRAGHWDVWLVDSEGTFLTQVTDDQAEDRSPAWSPEGKAIGFDSNRSGNWDLWKAEILPVELVQRIAFTRGHGGQQELHLMDVDGSHEFQLTHNPVWDGEMRWSPSGQRLAFVRAVPDRQLAAQEVGYLASDELWVINVDGSNPRLILNQYLLEGLRQGAQAWVSLENVEHVQWALDESALYFEGMAAATSDAVFSVNLDGSNPHFFDGGNDLRMTAKGHLFYFQHNYYLDGARNESYLLDRDGHELRSFGELHDFYPSISPDETKLIYFAHPNNEQGLEQGVYLWKLDTGETVKLMEGLQQAGFHPSPEAEYYDTWMDWSPDNQRIVYVSDREGNKELYAMDLEALQETRLTRNPAADHSPRWSPDGQQIAFVSERDGNPEIYVMDADGSYQTRLTNNTEPDLDPQWSPVPVPRLVGFEAWPLYQNHKYGGFTLQYPSYWTLGPEPFIHDGRSFISPQGEAQVSAFVFNQAIDGSNAKGWETLDEHVSKRLESAKDRQDFKLLRQQDMTLSGRKGRELLYTYTASPGGQPMEERAIYVLGLESGAGLRLVAPERSFEAYNRIFELMLGTYQLTLDEFQP